MRRLVPFEEAGVVDEVLHQEIVGVADERGGILDLVERGDRRAEDVEDHEGDLPLLHRVVQKE